jgi:glyceraldehyde-3-phosphate dehydrogenase/erythrose-4-phosphate dehydrogenase
MEIKTEYEIFWNHNHHDENQRKKKWVSVENEIEFLKLILKDIEIILDCTGIGNFKESTLKHKIENRIKQLKGE